MANVFPKIRVRHHHLAAAVLARAEKGVKQLTATIKSYTNPFSDIDTTNTDLLNLVTKVVMPERVKKDLCEQRKIGSQLLDSCVKDRIQSGKENLWSPMKNRKLLTLKLWQNPESDSGRQSRGTSRGQVSFRTNDDGVQEPTRSQHQGSCWSLRIFGGSKIAVCCRWHNASLFIQEYSNAHPRQAQ